MFNTQLRGKLSKVYIEWRNKQVSNMVLIAAAEISPLLAPKPRWDLMFDPSYETLKPSYEEGLNLWKVSSEVSNAILEDMKKAKDEQNMKTFHQFEEDAKGIDRYSPSGAQGDMLRFRGDIQQVEEENEYESRSQEAFELKEMHKNENIRNFNEFKAMDDFRDSIELRLSVWFDFEFEWFRTISETSKFDKKSKRIQQAKKSECETRSEADSEIVFDSREEVGHKVWSDVEISTPKWPANIRDKGEIVSLDPQTKPVLLRTHKSLTEETGSLGEENNPSPCLAKWMEPLRLCRIDWIALLDGLKQHTTRLYFKVAKLVLGEESFRKTKMGDHSMLVEAHFKQDAQGILKKMNSGGITSVTNRYIMGGKPGHAKVALECLRSQGFQLDTKVINSMIMACINAGEPKLGESLMTVAESTGVQLTEEMYMALLRSYSQLGDVDGAIRIATGMDSSGFLPSLESCNLLVRAYGRAGKPHQARRHFDRITKLGLEPDEKCIANALVAYERKGLESGARDILDFGVHIPDYSVLEADHFTTVVNDYFPSRV